MDFSTPSFPVLHHFLELTQTHIFWVSYTIQPCHPVSSPLLLPSVFPSIRVFSNELAFHIRWSKYRNSSFNISPSNEYSGLISFRIDWFELFSVQGILNSLVRHHSSRVSILQHPAFFMIQLSHPYMTTGKTIALSIWTFVGKVNLCFLICCLCLSELFFLADKLL